MSEIAVRAESELPQAADALLKAYPDSRVFACYGQMGAGKTTFIKILCKTLGVPDIVQSPTFAIINEYKRDSGESVFHFDFYRIKKAEEAFDIGYEDYVYSGSYCFIEWPELIEGLLPEDAVRVVISGTEERVITF
jgi:tRNA threonylcarbamoyladenosine biosynthesis protein TsaE